MLDRLRWIELWNICWAQGNRNNTIMKHRQGQLKCGKHFKKMCDDAKHLYKFPKNQKFTVHLTDISKAEGWSMDSFDKLLQFYGQVKQECS